MLVDIGSSEERNKVENEQAAKVSVAMFQATPVTNFTTPVEHFNQ